MTRPPTGDHQRKIDTGRRREVRIAVVTRTEYGAQCSCGKAFTQPRKKVREKEIDRHVDRAHGGQGIRL